MSQKFTFLFLVIFFVPVLYSQIPQPDHIVIVIEENHGYDQIIGNSSAPYINSLTADQFGASFTDSHGETHPSQPNYLWLLSGDNQGVTDDNIPTDTPFTTQNLGAELLANNLTFAGFSEDLPYEGFSGGSSGAYARKHNPWVNWQDANPNGIPWNLNKPFSEFPSDYSLLPTVSFVIPNLNNDMHDGTVAQGDTWLQNNLDGYIQWAKTHNSLFIFTFDEDNGTNENWIPTLFVGEMVQHGEYSQTINHLNVLRTIEDMYGLGYAGSSGDSSAISNCWNSVIAVELTSFTASFAGDNVTLSWSTSTETNNRGFEIQRRVSMNENKILPWTDISFVNGSGTSAEHHNYTYDDHTIDQNNLKYQYRLKQIDFNGEFNYSKIVDISISQPNSFKLYQNYPNPFNPTTAINYTIPALAGMGSQGVKVTLKVYNLLGNEVATLVNENEQAGNHEAVFNAGILPSGVYFYQLRAGTFVQTKKMMLIK